ncbi:hypothetical protein MLD38_029640 [Melastoma candidum]|uniref:Uncharacterized protein n=1 Tax=Melastoma candidum TaxID=119954 RepID=A0ACB9N4C3_9MYRT|nr:hypothetical protein MLD38_029640 [Melastoma candidum]
MRKIATGRDCLVCILPAALPSLPFPSPLRVSVSTECFASPLPPGSLSLALRREFSPLQRRDLRFLNWVFAVNAIFFLPCAGIELREPVSELLYFDWIQAK